MNWSLIPIPFLVPLAVHWLYQPVNENWTVKTFGCGCPPLDLSWRFNANHFNTILWLVVFSLNASLLVKVFPVEQRERESGAAFLSLGFVALLFLCAKQWARECWL